MNFRRAKLSLHHAVGSSVPGYDPASLVIERKGQNGDDLLLEVPEYMKFLNGSLGSLDASWWYWEEITLPILSYEDKIQFKSSFQRMKSGANFDNLHIYTRDK